MPAPTITQTTSTINLQLNAIQKKQEDEIKKAVTALTQEKPPAVSRETNQAVKVASVTQSNSPLPKG